MAEINRARWAPLNTSMHLKHLMKIKQRRLHEDSCTHDNVAKYEHSNEDLTIMTEGCLFDFEDYI